ncbi:amino acid adenylation domain-containing protein [Amycolatopsis sp. cmx-11-12]|uniref:amino acid adenylation domain-containing protein n=1 Tax=Amycolatopsis sp. cmx-11-12 TaxID=2785795 RepID=UPI003917C481
MTGAGQHGADVDTDLDAVLRGLSPEKRRLVAAELARRAVAASAIPGTARTGDPLPCSYAQERLWYLEQADPGSIAYVVPAAVRFTGVLRVDALRRSLDEIVRRHEVLRTTFTDRGGVPGQLVHAAAPLTIPLVDLSDRSAEAAEAEVRDRYQQEVRLPFDLATGPLIRACVLKVSDTEHVLLLSTHHIVSDGWSLGVLQQELTTLYQAYVTGEASPLPELPVQYADFAVWQRGRLDGGELDEQVSYWRDHLAFAPVLELPTDKLRPATRSSAGESVPLRLGADTVRAVEKLAESEQATQFMVLLAAYTVLLRRWSGQQEMIIGSPIANRGHVDIEPLVGFFVNTLPLRMDTSGDPSFRELVQAARAECLAAYAHQDLPFERMVAESGVDRSAGSIPLVQTLLALRNVPMAQLRLPGLQVSELDLRTESTKFDLTLDLVPTTDGGLDGRAEFSSDLFEADTVRRMVAAFDLLLAAGLADPETPVSRLPIAGPGELAEMIEVASGGGSAAPAKTAGTLHGLFERQVDLAPDAEAVAFGEQVLTYRELDERANRLAWFLRAEGVRPEQLVGISLPRSELMIVAVLGILKAGAGYVPLDPNYPRRRVAYMAEDAGAALVLTHSSVADPDRVRTRDDNEDTRLVCLDVEAERIAGYPAERPPAVVAEPNLAYVIYTSGSTGRPKGSANEHGRVANTLHGVNGAYALTSADRMLAISSLNYDMSVYEVFGTLAAGATIVVPSDIETTDPEQLLDLLRTMRVTAWSSAPALLDMLVNHAYRRDGMDGVVLRAVGLGGDRMPPALPGRLAELVPGVRLLNLAGMTEASYCSTFHPVAERSPAGVLWGRSLPNHRLYVLDEHGEPTPPGVAGELFIGGAGPGRGYWHQPGLTAQRFLPDPYSPEPGGRMYATGDHARFLASGDLDFLGRLDLQVKIRGFRIELGEIENVLSGHPSVTEPVVVAYTDAVGERRLAAYVTPNGDNRPTAAELRAHLSDRLPDHMVPSAYLVLDKLPLLPSGKLNRAALPAPGADRPETSYTAPAGALEQLLADLWSELLAVPRIGSTDDFFELGGHSLLATQAVSRIRELLRVKLDIPGFLAARTVRAVAAYLRELGTVEGIDVDAVAELVLEVSAMSDEEARDRL